MSDYWTTVYGDDCRLRDLERLEPGAVFDWLNANLPAIGSAVDWARVSGEHRHWCFESDEDRAVIVSEFLAGLPPPDRAVLHEGDSLSPFPVRIEPADLSSAVEALLEIPEHHYLVDERHAWVGVFRTEGDVDLVIFRPEAERSFGEDD